MQLRFASLLICTGAITLVACSSTPTTPAAADTATEEDTFVVGDDTSPGEDSGEEDSSSGDSTTVDTGTSETAGDSIADTKEVSVKCFTPGATESEACGKCGTRARLCNSDLTWLPWGLCTGETGVCVPGETRSTTCGRCGTRMESCSSMCEWDAMACTGEGLCNAGDMEIQTGACSNPTYVKTRTCSTTACTWGDWSGCVPPKGWVEMATAPITGRYYHSTVWSGTEMIVWGGYTGSFVADGAAYRLSSNTWRTIASAPTGFLGRRYHTAVWTGSKMIVWGGATTTSYTSARNDGAVYDPATDTWTSMTTTGAPSARYYHTAVWSGSKMIVWGGYNGSYLADGAAYDPVANSWSPIAAAPLAARQQHSAEFVDGKMVVYGGYGSTYYGDSATYNPVGDSWATLSPPSTELEPRSQAMSTFDPLRKQVAFWGGYGGSYTFSSYNKGTGGIFNVATGTWRGISQPADAVLPYPRRYVAATWWSPEGFFVWGGTGAMSTSSSSNSYNATGAMFEPTSGTWRAMSDSNAPAGRQYPTAVWTGSEAIIWGGYNGSLSPYYRNDGKIYRP